MATREKTIEFSIPSSSVTVADAVVTNLSQITLYIPEASPVFRSVFVEIAFNDLVTATGGTITEHRCALRLGAAGYTTITELDDIANTGENIAGVLGPFDFTSHFTTNWTGTSMTCDIQVYFDQNTGTTLGMTNVSAKIYITYEYDDTAATQIKTVRIPLESLTTTLGTTAANFGTNQIPLLDTFLPEAGKTIRDYHFVIEGNMANNNATTDWTLNADIDAAGAVSFGLSEAALGSDCFMRWIHKPGSVPATNATHNLRLWTVGIARCNHVTVTLVVTYEFTLAGTTRMLNSVLLPIEFTSPIGSTTTAEASRTVRSILCVEPGTLTLRQSAVRVNWIWNAGNNFLLRAGAQAYRTYTSVANVVCGMFSVQQRIDSGSAQGAGFTLARGYNTFTVDMYLTNATNDLTNVNGYIILNYESDVPTEGVGAASHSVKKLVAQWDAALVDRRTVADWSFSIPETDYFMVGVALVANIWTSTAATSVGIDLQVQPGEADGGGYTPIYMDAYQADAERACSILWSRARDAYKRFPQDADTSRLNIETARDVRLYVPATAASGLYAVVTYHSMTWSVAGSLTGANPGLATDLKLIRDSDDAVLQEQTLAAGDSTFDFTVYDNTENYYVVARQNDTLVGRSGNSLAA